MLLGGVIPTGKPATTTRAEVLSRVVLMVVAANVVGNRRPDGRSGNVCMSPVGPEVSGECGVHM